MAENLYQQTDLLSWAASQQRVDGSAKSKTTKANPNKGKLRGLSKPEGHLSTTPSSVETPESFERGKCFCCEQEFLFSGLDHSCCRLCRWVRNPRPNSQS